MRRVSHMLSSNRGWVQIIPRAIDYFTGKALEYEDFDDDDDFEDIEDDEDDEDEFEDDVCLYLVPLSCWPPLTIGVSLCRIRTRTATCPRGDGGRRRAGALQIRMSTRKSASSSDLTISGLAYAYIQTTLARSASTLKHRTCTTEREMKSRSDLAWPVLG